MKKVLVYSLITLLLSIVYQSVLPHTIRAEEGAVLNADEIIKNVDPTKFTKAQLKEFYKNVDGKQAKGAGTVVNVLPGKRDKHRVTILTSASKPEKGYNIVLYTTQDAPSELHKNDRIVFEGEVGRISTFRGASVDILGTYKKAPIKR